MQQYINGQETRRARESEQMIDVRAWEGKAVGARGSGQKRRWRRCGGGGGGGGGGG